MGPGDRLFESILAAPDDEALRLACSDYFEERAAGPADLARAEFIRMQCEMDGLKDQDPRRPALQLRASGLLLAHARRWNAPLHRFLHTTPLRNQVAGRRAPVRGWRYRRGFVEAITVHAAAFLEHADVLFRLGPIGQVRLLQASGLMRQLAESPFLGRLRALDLSGNGLLGHVLTPLLESPQLPQHTLLNLDGNHLNWRALQHEAERLGRSNIVLPWMATLPPTAPPPDPGTLMRAWRLFRRLFGR